MAKNYYNTTGLSGNDLKKAEKKSISQEEIILHLFKSRNRDFTRSEVIAMGILNKRTPETSYTRALSNLAKDGLLIKTSIQRIGPYGRPEYTWKYNRLSEIAGKFENVKQGNLFEQSKS